MMLAFCVFSFFFFYRGFFWVSVSHPPLFFPYRKKNCFAERFVFFLPPSFFFLFDQVEEYAQVETWKCGLYIESAISYEGGNLKTVCVYRTGELSTLYWLRINVRFGWRDAQQGGD